MSTDLTEDNSVEVTAAQRACADEASRWIATYGSGITHPSQLQLILNTLRALNSTGTALSAVAFDCFWRVDPAKFHKEQFAAQKIVDYYDDFDNVHQPNERLVFIWPEHADAPTGIDLYQSVMLLLKRLAEVYAIEPGGYAWHVVELANLIGSDFPGGYHHQSNESLKVMARRAWDRINSDQAHSTDDPPSDD